ncbi:WecB/TagA/CpsF family glycosyltransferase [Phaeobacter italicus]|uniref:WecB/TagA/CpsF family glycosyltransferase n=1 Tax=Phaeobacter italicus TaxID=481446 RepID=UPI001ADD450F|nr:WecB/TagA/CpsF family glycosyltransferase [Phaeobacter italicus]MBO9440996.1 WecB/TagA/CpsF family glycosyltransferase [Phaeobacter italicus]
MMSFQSPLLHTTPVTPVSRPALATQYLPALDLNLVDETADKTVRALLAPGRRRVFFMNAHCCNIRRQDRGYADAVARADMLLPDGAGIELAARFTGQKLAANLNGTDLLPKLLEQAATRGKSVYLFGGKPGVADAAAAQLILTTPNLRIAGTRDGYGGAADPEAVIADINESGADILLVAMGVPLQEMWLDRYADRLTADLTLAVGAFLDFSAGVIDRAPRLVRQARMEWGWRLMKEPRRLAKRYLVGNFTFVANAARRAFATAENRAKRRIAAKRVLDVATAATALVLLAPVFALTALAIRAESRGPVIFRQTRVGQNGETFTMFKFRSMSQDAEARRAAVLSQSDRDGVCFKAKADPRITRVGRFIRRASIDELPQIFNVLRGDMSIVGPRPALPVEVDAYPPRALRRLAVKPGITGVWQVSGRADVGFDEMVEMDIAYAKEASVGLDLTLMYRTIGAVLSGRGAY